MIPVDSGAVFGIRHRGQPRGANDQRGKAPRDGRTNHQSGGGFGISQFIVPGGVALLSDTVGFITLLSIDIGIIRELAISASLGVGVIIFTNLILLPLVISFTEIKVNKTAEPTAEEVRTEAIWRFLARFATPKYAVVVIIATVVLYFAGLQQANQMKIGDLQGGRQRYTKIRAITSIPSSSQIISPSLLM